MNRYFLFLILFFWLGMPVSSTASTPDFWTKSGFTYEGNKTPIKNVLEEFSHSFGVELIYSDAVTGTLDGWQKGDSGTDFLNALGVKYKFQWFVFKSKLYISPNSDSVVKRIRVDQKAAVNMEEALKGVDLFEKKFGWGQLADEGVVLLSGPRQYVDFVKELVEEREDKRNDKEIMMFPLKYASVADRQVQYRDKTLTIPGVASILQNLVKGKNSGENGIAEKDPAFGSGDALKETKGVFDESYVKSNSAIQVEGDVRTNSIIIHDYRKKEWYYRNLISKIDVEKKLIEIEAIIVDIDRSNLKEFGTNWRVNDINGASLTVLNSLSQLNQSINGAATIEISDVGSFRAMLQALESSGTASIMANTSILTVENQPAVFDLSETRYVQSVGERVAQFESITAGTLLHVVPRNITGVGADQVQLLVDIEDGQIIDTRADGRGLPSVKKISINTSAIVDEGRSLVVGGYNVQSDTNQKNKVPLLGDIPLVGSAFSHKKRVESKRERLFILTPRLSSLANIAAIEPPQKNTLAYDYLSKSNNKNISERLQTTFQHIALGEIPIGYELAKEQDIPKPIAPALTAPAATKSTAKAVNAQSTIKATAQPAVYVQAVNQSTAKPAANGRAVTKSNAQIAVNTQSASITQSVQVVSPIPCDIAGVRSGSQPVQHLVGRDIDIYVSSIENTSGRVINLSEERCAGANVLAVTFWPLTSLAPGQKTEYFVAKMRNPSNSRSRPSLIN